MKPIDYIRLIQEPLCPHCLAGFMDEQLNTRVTCGKTNITLVVGLPCSYQDWLECPLNKPTPRPKPETTVPAHLRIAVNKSPKTN